MHKLEGQVLNGAALHVATSAPLAVALTTWFGLSREFSIVPSGGRSPLGKSISTADGPFVYCGAIGDGSELTGLIQAAQDTKLPLKIVGGTEEEWDLVARKLIVGGIEWQPRVHLHEIPEALSCARAGLIPTNAAAHLTGIFVSDEILRVCALRPADFTAPWPRCKASISARGAPKFPVPRASRGRRR